MRSNPLTVRAIVCMVVMLTITQGQEQVTITHDKMAKQIIESSVRLALDGIELDLIRVPDWLVPKVQALLGDTSRMHDRIKGILPYQTKSIAYFYSGAPEAVKYCKSGKNSHKSNLSDKVTVHPFGRHVHYQNTGRVLPVGILIPANWNQEFVNKMQADYETTRKYTSRSPMNKLLDANDQRSGRKW